MSPSNLDPAVPPVRPPLLPRRVLSWVVWSLALIVLGGTAWLAGQVLGAMANVLVPLAIAMLFVALLTPLDRMLRRVLPRGFAAVLTVLVLLALLGGVGLLTKLSIASRWNRIVYDFTQSFSSLLDGIRRLPLPTDVNLLNRAETALQDAIRATTQGLPSTLLTVTQTTVEVGAGTLLCLFAVIFLLYDGPHVWNWARNLLPGRAPQRLADAGEAAWTALTGFVQGTFIIACIHGTVIGSALWLLGVDLALPLALLVFIGSFVPIIGALATGGVAVLITLGTHGLVPALILLGVLIFEHEFEAHVLQPFVVGRYVRLHPLAIVVVLGLGTYQAGIAGALLVVPAVGAARAAWGPLNGRPSVVPVGRPSRISRLLRWARASVPRPRRR
ncbi:MAG: AI-2E family transporter [Propionibacteriaceae bacterium]